MTRDISGWQARVLCPQNWQLFYLHWKKCSVVALCIIVDWCLTLSDIVLEELGFLTAWMLQVCVNTDREIYISAYIYKQKNTCLYNVCNVQINTKWVNLISSAVDCPPHPLLILGHPVDKNLAERTNQKSIQRCLEIQPPQKFRNALNMTSNKLPEIQVQQKC